VAQYLAAESARDKGARTLCGVIVFYGKRRASGRNRFPRQ